jgi:hypothetical protein
MNWYYESAGQQQGPVTDSEIDRRLAEGKITPDTLVWREGLVGWSPLRTARPAPAAPEAQAPLAPPPPPAAPAPGADAPPPGYIRCSLTGKYFPPSEIIYIEGRPYSAEAKPQVMQSLQAGAALPSNPLDRTGPAWEQREQIGVVKALTETIKAVLMQPSQVFATMKREGGLGTPLLYWFLTAGIGVAVSQIYGLFLQGAMFSMFRSFGGANAGGLNAAALGLPMFVQVGMIIVYPVLMLVVTFIYAGLAHLSLMMLKGANRPFETTMRAVCYATGTGGALYVIPLCGGLIGLLWALVALCIGLGKAHDTTTEKGVGGTLLPMAFCCVMYFVLIVIIGASVAAIGAAAQGHH